MQRTRWGPGSSPKRDDKSRDPPRSDEQNNSTRKKGKSETHINRGGPKHYGTLRRGGVKKGTSGRGAIPGSEES